VHPKILPIFFGVVFALTLLFAAVGGAQEKSVDAESVGVQAVEIQQQQVSNDQQPQQQVVAVQQGQVGVQSHQSCPGAQHERTITNPTRREVIRPNIAGGAVRITYEISDLPEGEDAELFVELRDEDGDIVISETVDDVTTEPETIRVSTNPGRHEFEVEADAGVKYRVELEDCTNVEARNDNNNTNNDGDTNNDTSNNTTDNNTDDGTVTTAQDTTTPTNTTTDTNTANLNTANPAAELTTADDGSNAESVREADAFRCEFFLRVVRDERGALRDQYRDDELIVQRFEQCLSEDVLADTIPDRQLPFTGGLSLPFGGGLLLLVAAVALAGRIIRR
jgi:hypothetical protein